MAHGVGPSRRSKALKRLCGLFLLETGIVGGDALRQPDMFVKGRHSLFASLEFQRRVACDHSLLEENLGTGVGRPKEPRRHNGPPRPRTRPRSRPQHAATWR